MSTRSVLLAVLLGILLALASLWLVRSPGPPAAVTTPEILSEIAVESTAHEAARQAQILRPGERRELELAVLAGQALHGRVLEKGAPVEKQEVWLVEKRSDEPVGTARSLARYEKATQIATTDSGGHFRFDAVLPGTWRVGTAPTEESWDGDGMAPMLSVAETVDVLAGVTPREVVLHVERGTTIRGRVVSPTGDPLPGMSVFATSRAPLTFTRVASQSGGTFVVGPLLAGEYTLSADPVHGEHAPSEPVLARAGAVDVVLRLQPGASIEGLVVDRATRAACAADVMLIGGVEGSTFDRDSLAPEGRFEFRGLSAGRYTATARTGDGRIGLSQAIDLGTGARLSDIEVVVETGAKLRLVRPEKSAAIRVEIWHQERRIGVEFVRGGAGTLLTVPAGELSLRTRAPPPAESRRRDVMLAAGEERSVTIDGAP